VTTISGRCIEAGDDAEGQPRITIHTTREALRDGPWIVMKDVAVSVDDQTDWKARAEAAEKACAEMRDVIAKCGVVFDAVRAKGGTKTEAFRLADAARKEAGL
jgi:hypothetical protein